MIFISSDIVVFGLGVLNKLRFFFLGNPPYPGSVSRVPPISKCDRIGGTANRRRAGEDCKTHWFNSTFAYGDVRWMQENTRMRYLHGRIPRRWCSTLSALHAYLPYELHWRLAYAQFDMSELYGACRRCLAHKLWDQLTASALQLWNTVIWTVYERAWMECGCESHLARNICTYLKILLSCLR